MARLFNGGLRFKKWRVAASSQSDVKGSNSPLVYPPPAPPGKTQFLDISLITRFFTERRWRVARSSQPDVIGIPTTILDDAGVKRENSKLDSGLKTDGSLFLDGAKEIGRAHV